MDVELRPSSSFSRAALADLFNAGYEGYVIPFRLDEAAFDAMVDAFDIDLDASRVALRDGEPVALANLARRGDEAWIGGVGVVPSARRRGIGELLMRELHEQARSRGVERVRLEVIEENDAAFRLYDKLGYEVVRPVEVWTLTAEVAPGAAREVPAERAHERVRALRSEREPWQRADATLATLDGLRGVETDGGAAVYRVEGGSVRLQQIAGDDADELLRTLRAQGSVIVLNLPQDDPAAAALRELGGTVAVRQREMVLRL